MLNSYFLKNESKHFCYSNGIALCRVYRGLTDRLPTPWTYVFGHNLYTFVGGVGEHQSLDSRGRNEPRKYAVG